MEWEIIILNRISQTQKSKCHTFSHIYKNLDFFKCMKAERGSIAKDRGTRGGKTHNPSDPIKN